MFQRRRKKKPEQPLLEQPTLEFLSTPESSHDLEMQLIEAAEAGHLETVTDLCEKRGISVNGIGVLNEEKLGHNKATVQSNKKYGIYETALSGAVRSGHNEVVSYLVQHQASTEQTYPFLPTKFYPRYKKSGSFTPAYTESLLGMACYSAISHEVFGELLKNTKNLNPPVINYSGPSTEDDEINLLKLIYNEHCKYRNQRILTTDAAIRIRLIICEGMLRFDESVLNEKIKFENFLNEKALEAYISDVKLDDTQVIHLNRSIQLMVKNKSISIQLGNQLLQMIKATVANQHGCSSSPSSSTRSILSTMKLNRLTDETPSDSEENEKNASSHLSSSQEIAGLKRENRELLAYIHELKKGQTALKERIEILTKQMDELLERDKPEYDPLARRMNH